MTDQPNPLPLPETEIEPTEEEIEAEEKKRNLERVQRRMENQTKLYTRVAEVIAATCSNPEVIEACPKIKGVGVVMKVLLGEVKKAMVDVMKEELRRVEEDRKAYIIPDAIHRIHHCGQVYQPNERKEKETKANTIIQSFSQGRTSPPSDPTEHRPEVVIREMTLEEFKCLQKDLTTLYETPYRIIDLHCGDGALQLYQYKKGHPSIAVETEINSYEAFRTYFESLREGALIRRIGDGEKVSEAWNRLTTDLYYIRRVRTSDLFTF